MRTLSTLLFALIIGVGYLFFFRAESAPQQTNTTPVATAPVQAPTEPMRGHDPFKESLDRAHAAANQIKAAHAETDSL